MIFFIFIQILIEYILQANGGDPDHTPHSDTSGQVPHYLPISHKKDAWLIWVNVFKINVSKNSFRKTIEFELQTVLIQIWVQFIV